MIEVVGQHLVGSHQALEIVLDVAELPELGLPIVHHSNPGRQAGQTRFKRRVLRMKVFEHQFPTGNGYFEIKWMNGAIVTNRGSTIGSISDIPYVYPRGEDLYLNMINLTANRSGFGSAGRGSYDITLRKVDTTTLIDKQVYSFHMSMHTEYSQGWNIYFDNHRDFESVKNARYTTIALGYRIGEYTNLTIARTGLELTGVT